MNDFINLTYNWARDTPQAFRTGLSRWPLRSDRTSLSLGTLQSRLSLLEKYKNINRMGINLLRAAYLFVILARLSDTKGTGNLHLLDLVPSPPFLLVFPQVLQVQGDPVQNRKR